MWLLFLIFALAGSTLAQLQPQCTYSFQCIAGRFCHEGQCRLASCTSTEQCAPGELCHYGNVDGRYGEACFPFILEKPKGKGTPDQPRDYCPGGGKPIFALAGREYETCSLHKQCMGSGICNPLYGICCTKLRTCPFPSKPLLNPQTKKSTICRFRNGPVMACPLGSTCEQRSGFCCTSETEVTSPDGKPYVGQPCQPTQGCTGNAACVCLRPNICGCECPKEIGYSVDVDGKTCKRSRRRLREKCKSDVECSAAYSECTSGGCRCKMGFQRDGAGGCKPIAYKCVNNGQAFKRNGQILMCQTSNPHRVMFADLSFDNSTDPEIDVAPIQKRSVEMATSCPQDHYCVPVFDIPKEPNLYQGFCCPIPTPNNPTCPVGNAHESSSHPDYGCQSCPSMTHFCHSDRVGTDKQICCPKPCVSLEDVYIDGQCYPIAYHGDSCFVSEQCVGKNNGYRNRADIGVSEDMQCVRGVCECPKGYHHSDGLCKRLLCNVGLRTEPSVDRFGKLIKCTRSADCSQGSMCDPTSKVCCRGINRCPKGFVETGEDCMTGNCHEISDRCIVPKNSKSKICCRREY
ncbi:hypothetical protein QR680_014961 [Steinernema hermaphroditum]|uniref:EB domain-containing protein n=1 Tax=Steinernema hermaphroditum TaxID=289476 RepID=A0AA39ID80_9BILA|nr:hypothetical protein QR680_014961 [Steinernema hermaphroditum]